MKSKVLILLIFLPILLVGNISAFNIDNVKSYDKKEIYGTYEVDNAFGLGKKLAEYTLEENTELCEYNQCYAKGTATIYSQGKLFTDLYFESLNDKNFGRKVNIVGYQIFLDGELYQGQVLSEGTYIWEIKGQVEEDQSVDWIAEAFGEKFKEWAVWNSDSVNSRQWIFWGRNLNNTRYYPYNTTTSTNLLCTFDAYGRSSVSVSNGTAIVGSVDTDTIYAFNATTCNLIWSFYDGFETNVQPTISGDYVFIGSAGGNRMRALNFTNGSEVWNFSAESIIHGSSSPIYKDRIIFGTDNLGVFILNATNGSKICNTTVHGSIYNAPSIMNDVAYFGEGGGNTYNNFTAIDTDDCSVVWDFKPPEAHEGNRGSSQWSAPALYGGRSYFTTDLGIVYALNLSTGVHIWNYSVNGTNYTAHKIEGGVSIKNDILYFNAMNGTANENGYTIAINATDGTFIWRTPLEFDDSDTTPLTTETHLITSDIGAVYIMNLTNGSIYSNITVGRAAAPYYKGIHRGSITVADRILYVQSYGNHTFNTSVFNITVAGEDTGETQFYVTQKEPPDSSVFQATNVSFIGEANYTSGILNISLYLDGLLNYTVFNTTAVENITLATELNISEGTHNWSIGAYNSAGDSTITSNRTFIITTVPDIHFTSPTLVNSSNISINSFEVNVSVTEDYFNNITFNLYNKTDGAELNETTYTDSTRLINWSGLADGNYSYNVTVWTTTDQINYTETRELNIDSHAPNVEFLEDNFLVNYFISGNNLTLNWSVDDSHLNSCLLEYGGANYTVICGDNNITNITINSATLNSSTICADDEAGNMACNFTDWDYKIFENSKTYNTTTYETGTETFLINVTTNSSLSSAKIYYNGTEYTATKSGELWYKEISLNNSNVGADNEIYWNFTYASEVINSSIINQDVSWVAFGLCNETLNMSYANFTFKDESDDSDVIAAIPYSTFNYFIGNGNANKTYTFTNTSENLNYDFCFYPDNLNISSDIYIQYYNSTDYPQRIYNPPIKELNNVSTNIVLYLLGSGDGIYVTFQVINSATQALEGVNVNATREIGGVDTLVGQGTTGADGTVTFWLNPNFIHTFSFDKTGYDLYTTEFTPTQTSYTITLSGGEASVTESYYKGITFAINPTNTSLVNDTIYSFQMQLNSSYWDLDSYGFNLRFTNGTYTDIYSTTIEGTIVSTNFNVGNETRIYMDYYWVIDGNYTNNSFYWNVYNTDKTQWSIAHFFTDLSLYLDSGIFGLDNFGKNLIIFLIIFITIGVLGYKYGATSPIFVFSIIFGVIFFFDVAIEILPSFTTSGGMEIEHFYTFIAGLILVIIGIREVSS